MKRGIVAVFEAMCILAFGALLNQSQANQDGRRHVRTEAGSLDLGVCDAQKMAKAPVGSVCHLDLSNWPGPVCPLSDSSVRISRCHSLKADWKVEIDPHTGERVYSDLNSGLRVTEATSSSYVWKDAKAYCESKNGFRLPTAYPRDRSRENMPARDSDFEVLWGDGLYYVLPGFGEFQYYWASDHFRLVRTSEGLREEAVDFNRHGDSGTDNPDELFRKHGAFCVKGREPLPGDCSPKRMASAPAGFSCHTETAEWRVEAETYGDRYRIYQDLRTGIKVTEPLNVRVHQQNASALCTKGYHLPSSGEFMKLEEDNFRQAVPGVWEEDGSNTLWSSPSFWSSTEVQTPPDGIRYAYFGGVSGSMYSSVTPHVPEDVICVSDVVQKASVSPHSSR